MLQPVLLNTVFHHHSWPHALQQDVISLTALFSDLVSHQDEVLSAHGVDYPAVTHVLNF